MAALNPTWFRAHSALPPGWPPALESLWLGERALWAGSRNKMLGYHFNLKSEIFNLKSRNNR